MRRIGPTFPWLFLLRICLEIALPTWAGSPLIIPGPCQEAYFYYENYASYKCIDGRKVFQNCVPLNEPHSQAISINSTLITPHFRSICVQYAPDRVQFVRTHCVDSTEEMPKFMKPNSEVDYPDKRIRCVFDPQIQTLRKLVITKRKKRICRHKKDQKLEQNVHFQCWHNAFWPEFCLGKDAQGKDLRVDIGKELWDGLDYMMGCQVLKMGPKPGGSKKKPGKKVKEVPMEVALRRVHCVHKYGLGTLPVHLFIGQDWDFPDGTGTVRCVNESGQAQKLLEPKEPPVNVDCLTALGPSGLFSCRGLVYRQQMNGPLMQVGCADPLAPARTIPKEQRAVRPDGAEFECRDQLELTGCFTPSGKHLNIGQAEGQPIAGTGTFQRCEAGRGLVTYNEGDCQFGNVKIALGQSLLIPVEGAGLRPRLFCERQRLKLGEELAQNLGHKAFWNVLVQKDCVDNFGNVIPLKGFIHVVGSQTSPLELVEFCLKGGIQRGRPIGCKFNGQQFGPGQHFLLGQDRMECQPDGRVRRVGCHFEPKNISLELGQIEPVPGEQPQILLHCHPKGTGLRATNGAKACLKEETGEQFAFGTTDEEFNAIRVCERKADPEVRGIWQITHCLFGTVKVKRGECFFNQTPSEQSTNQNASQNGCQSLNGTQHGEYKLCEQDQNQQPVFLPASFEYCAPSQQVKATNSLGQLMQAVEKEMSRESFECQSDWKPKPLPIGLNETGVEEEGSGDYPEDSEEDNNEEEDEGKEAETSIEPAERLQNSTEHFTTPTTFEGEGTEELRALDNSESENGTSASEGSGMPMESTVEETVSQLMNSTESAESSEASSTIQFTPEASEGFTSSVESSSIFSTTILPFGEGIEFTTEEPAVIINATSSVEFTTEEPADSNKSTISTVEEETESTATTFVDEGTSSTGVEMNSSSSSANVDEAELTIEKRKTGASSTPSALIENTTGSQAETELTSEASSSPFIELTESGVKLTTDSSSLSPFEQSTLTVVEHTIETSIPVDYTTEIETETTAGSSSPSSTGESIETETEETTRPSSPPSTDQSTEAETAASSSSTPSAERTTEIETEQTIAASSSSIFSPSTEESIDSVVDTTTLASSTINLPSTITTEAENEETTSARSPSAIEESTSVGAEITGESTPSSADNTTEAETTAGPSSIFSSDESIEAEESTKASSPPSIVQPIEIETTVSSSSTPSTQQLTLAEAEISTDSDAETETSTELSNSSASEVSTSAEAEPTTLESSPPSAEHMTETEAGTTTSPSSSLPFELTTEAEAELTTQASSSEASYNSITPLPSETTKMTEIGDQEGTFPSDQNESSTERMPTSAGILTESTQEAMEGFTASSSPQGDEALPTSTAQFGAVTESTEGEGQEEMTTALSPVNVTENGQNNGSAIEQSPFEAALAQAIDQIVESEAEKARKKCQQKNMGKCEVESMEDGVPCRNRLSEHFCTAFKSMCLFHTGEAAIQSNALLQAIRYLRHFLGQGHMRSQLRLASHFLLGQRADAYGDKRLIQTQIENIAGLLHLLPSEDDLVELLLAEEGAPVLKQMLVLKQKADGQCAGIRKELEKLRTCLRNKNANLAKQFEVLLWRFRQGLDSFPHGVVWALCPRTCGRCQPEEDNWLEGERKEDNQLQGQLGMGQ